MRIARRVLARGFLKDLVRGAGGPFTEVGAAAKALSMHVVEVGASSPLRGLTDQEGAVYAHDARDAATGMAQGMLLRSGAGHRDDDVTELGRLLILDAQPG